MNPTANDCFAPLVEGLRGVPDIGEHRETVHWGSIVVVNGEGDTVAAVGDPRVTTPLRSTAKPFQLLPFVMDGLHENLARPRGNQGGSDECTDEMLADLAVMMSSHSGERIHTERIDRLLSTHGLSASSLQCGVHAPLYEPARQELQKSGRSPTELHCNCSGKHTNMLLVCQHLGWPLDNYLSAEHPLQRRIHNILLTLGEIAGPLPFVIDGCSLPTFVIGLDKLARLFSRLAWPDHSPSIEERDISPCLKLLRAAGLAHPELIGGTGRLDTQLMQAFGGQVFAKTGAAGVYCMAIAPNERFPQGLAVAIKIADGDPESRARRVTALEVLRQLAAMGPGDSPSDPRLNAICDPVLTNFRGLPVGLLRPVFKLSFE